MVLRTVKSQQDLAAFIGFPRSIHRKPSRWVDSIRADQVELLNYHHHPFYGKGLRAEIELFILTDQTGHRVIGRVAAIMNHLQNPQDHGTRKVGHFGFFESINSQEVANILLDAVSNWLSARKVEVVLGPSSPSQNYEYGLLIKGFEEPHRFQLSYNPPYYHNLLSSYGFEKAKDLFVFSANLKDSKVKAIMEDDASRFEAIWRKRFPYIRVRPINLKNLSDEVKTINKIMGEAFVRHWDYTPMSIEELEVIARKLRLLIDPGLIQIVEQHGQAAGIALAIPDFNEYIQEMRFHSGISQLLELVFRARLSRTNCARLLVLGVAQNQPAVGLAPFLLVSLYRHLITQGYAILDAHWILEDNFRVLDVVHRYQMNLDREFRIYTKVLHSAS